MGREDYMQTDAKLDDMCEEECAPEETRGMF